MRVGCEAAVKKVALLMLFAAHRLRLHPALKNPTVLIVVDRILPFVACRRDHGLASPVQAVGIQ
jgi:hypothetical protein